MDDQYDLTYRWYQRKKRLSFILQILFITVGALLIGSFAILFSNEPQKADALLSPIMSLSENNKKVDSELSLLYANPTILVYKDVRDNSQVISLVDRSTNLTTEVVNSNRVGFGGFTSDTDFYVLEDAEGHSKFKVYSYNAELKTLVPVIAFQAPSNISSFDIDTLIAISPDKTQLAITHSSGIVIYTIKTTKETTILENTNDEECSKITEQCIYYRKPLWVSNSLLLVYQQAINTMTPMIVNTSGTIQTVFPGDLTNLSPSLKGLPLVGVSKEGLHIVEPKKTTVTLETGRDTEYLEPVWKDENTIITLGIASGLPTVLQTDITGKKVVALKEFLTQTKLSNLKIDQQTGAIYFLAVTKSNLAINTQFFKFEKNDSKPVSFYTINKNLK